MLSFGDKFRPLRNIHLKFILISAKCYEIILVIFNIWHKHCPATYVSFIPLFQVVVEVDHLTPKLYKAVHQPNI